MNEPTKQGTTPEPVPFAVHECTVAHMQNTINRLFWALIATIALLFVTNMAWLWYESQYETISYTQDGEGLNNICTGEQGAIIFGADSEVQEEALRADEGAESP